jgi:aryl sulfotransferase
MVGPRASKYPSKSKDHVWTLEDSTRWNHYRPRRGDTVVSTYPKCGTTWMEHIVLNLRHYGSDIPLLFDVAPWLELRWSRKNMEIELPVEELIDWMERIPDLRQIKSHLALDYLPYYPEVKYLIVGRDMRDAYISWHNHILKADLFEERDLHAFWLTWMDKGAWVEKWAEGHAPPATGDTLHPHFQFYHNWWQYRHLDNIHLVHFNNLLGNPRAEIERIADFLEIAVDDAAIDAVTQATTFTSMKENAERLLSTHHRIFVNKGTNSRWKEILLDEDLALYDKAKAEAKSLGISTECLQWLETGR